MADAYFHLALFKRCLKTKSEKAVAFVPSSTPPLQYFPMGMSYFHLSQKYGRAGFHTRHEVLIQKLCAIE